MINHLRTLLSNRTAAYFANVSGAEYIPPAFQPVQLDAQLSKIYNVLFPLGIDKFTQNYIGTSIMNVVQSPDLVQLSTQFPDKRLTYTVGNSSLAKMTDAPVTMTLQHSTADLIPHYQLTLAGYPTDIRLVGQHQWILTQVTRDTVRVQYSRAVDPWLVRVTNSTVRGNNIDLLPGYLVSYFDLPSKVITGDFTLTYSTNIAIAYNIGEKLEELVQVLYQGGTMQRVFQLVPGFDTVNNAKDVFLNSPEAPLRFGAIVLAYLCQCDALWKKGSR